MSYRINTMDGAYVDSLGKETSISDMLSWRIDAQIVTLKDALDFRRGISQLEKWYRLFNQYPNSIVQGFNAGDIDKAKRQNRVAIVFALESPKALERNAGLVTVWAQLGVRFLRLYSKNGRIIISSKGAKKDLGLSDLGVDVIDMMNQNAMIADLTNASNNSIIEVIERTNYPVLINNLDVRGREFSRRFRGELGEALIKNNAVFGVNLSSFGTKRSVIEERCAHVRCWMEQFGDSALSLNIDSVPSSAQAFDELYKDMVFALSKVGVTKPQINGFFGDNWYRLFHNTFH